MLLEMREGQLTPPEERGASKEAKGRRQNGPRTKFMMRLLIFLRSHHGMLLPSRR